MGLHDPGEAIPQVVILDVRREHSTHEGQLCPRQPLTPGGVEVVGDLHEVLTSRIDHSDGEILEHVGDRCAQETDAFVHPLLSMHRPLRRRLEHLEEEVGQIHDRRRLAEGVVRLFVDR